MELNALEHIAKKCPLEYGPAVNKARVMAYQFTHKQYINQCEVSEPKNKNNKRVAEITVSSLTLVNVYPNPANTLVYIEADGYSNVDIKLYNIIGELMIEKQIDNTTAIDINDLSNGTYIYRIFNNGNILNTGKLIISK